MTKYLALAKTEKTGKVGFCYYDGSSKQSCELFTASDDQIENKVSFYRPDCLLFSSSRGLRRKHRIAKVESNFPYLKIVHVSGVSYLEKLIIAETISIPGFKRTPGEPWGSHIYSTYQYCDKKMDKVSKKALFVLYLHLNKPWQELITQSKTRENISNNLWLSTQKSINMSDLNIQVKELSEKLTEMSKLSYLGNLKSSEISFLIQKSRQFSQVLSRFYTLKKNEEEEELEKENSDKE